MNKLNYGFGEAPAEWNQHTRVKASRAKGHAASGMNKLVFMACDGDNAYHQEDTRSGTPASTFGRLAPAGAEPTHDDYEDRLRALADSMEGSSDIPGPAKAGMTFLGQFIDHDLTLDATTQLGKTLEEDISTLTNFRTPRLDLDCVYGDGPEASPHLFDKDNPGQLLFGRGAHEGHPETNDQDLPRNRQGRALIGDPRNDENLFVSQVHGRKFIAKHNELAAAATVEDDKKYEVARHQLTEWYHTMIVEDLLPSIVDAAVLQPFLDWLGGGAVPVAGAVTWNTIPDMPVEFSAAAYRFGHSMVRQRYALKEGVAEDIFNARIKGFSPVAAGDNLDLDLFFGPNAQSAEPIDTNIPNALLNLPDEIVGSGGERNLAFRNMSRGQITFRLPSGEQLANHLGFAPIAADDKVKAAGLEGATPLWYYILAEAETKDGKLGDVGGSIVAGVLVNLLIKGRSPLATPLVG